MMKERGVIDFTHDHGNLKVDIESFALRIEKEMHSFFDSLFCDSLSDLYKTEEDKDYSLNLNIKLSEEQHIELNCEAYVLGNRDNKHPSIDYICYLLSQKNRIDGYNYKLLYSETSSYIFQLTFILSFQGSLGI